MSTFLVTWIVVYVGGMVLSVIHPMYPMISYLTFYYAPPHVNWWGRYLPDLRYSLIASGGIVAGLFMKTGSLEPVARDRNRALPWLMLFGANTVLVTLWAFDRARSWEWTLAFLKLILLSVLIPATVRTPLHFDAFGAAHIAGASYWGYKAWDDPKRSAGRLENVGGPDTQNDNQAAGHLLTVIPFVALYVLTEKRKVRRAAVAVAGAFIVNVFILCNSRGATLGLIAMGLAAIMLAGKGKRVKLAGAVAAGAVAVLLLADPEYISRQQTTTDPNDNSAQSRLVMWRGGYEMVKDYPLGGGGRAFHILSPRYIPSILEKDDREERSPHNTYIQLATDWGVQGMVLWLLFMAATAATLRRIRVRAAGTGWFYHRALALQLALVGTLTAAFFSSRLYGESIYWMCSLAYALHRMQTTALEHPAGDQTIEVLDAGAASAAAPAVLTRGGAR